MAQEKVEAIRVAMEDANEGEFGPRFDSLFDPHLEFRDELGTLDNRDDLRAYIETFREAFGGFRVEIEEVCDLGDTIVLVIKQGGRGRASGLEVEQRFTWVMTFDRNRCTRWHIYADHEKALEA